MLVTWWLMLVTSGYGSLLLDPTFSMNETKQSNDFVQWIVRARAINVAQMKPAQAVQENVCPIFRLSDKWYVRQMKLFNFMNFRASWTLDKLHGSLHLSPNQTVKCDIKDFMKMVVSSEQRIQLRIPTIRGKLFPYYIFIYICLERNNSSHGLLKIYILSRSWSSNEEILL